MPVFLCISCDDNIGSDIIPFDGDEEGKVTVSYIVRDSLWWHESVPTGSFVLLPAYMSRDADSAAFIGWNTTADVIKGYFAPGDSCMVETDTNFYAIFVNAVTTTKNSK